MAEMRAVHEFPVNILQEIIGILLINKDDFEGEGKINNYYLIKRGNFATVVYDDKHVSYIANFVRDSQGLWFIVKDIAVDISLSATITKEALDLYRELYENLAERDGKTLVTTEQENKEQSETTKSTEKPSGTSGEIKLEK